MDAYDAAFANYQAQQQPGPMQAPPAVGQTQAADPYDAAYAQYLALGAGAKPKADTSALEAALIAAGHWLDRSAYGLQTAVAGALGPNVADAISNFGTKLGMAPAPSTAPDLTGLVLGQGNQSTAARAQQANEPIYAQVEKQHPVATFLGGAAPAMAAKTPLGMALLAAIQPGSATDRAENAAFGYGGGVLGNAIGSGVARLFGPASRAAGDTGSLYDEFFSSGAPNQYGIPQTVGQVTGYKPAQIAESVMQNLPFSAGTMAKAQDAQFGAFNRTVSNMMGIDSTTLTPDVIGAAKKAAGQKIGDVMKRNDFVYDEPLAIDLDAIQGRINNELVGEQAQLAQKQLNNFKNLVGAEPIQVPPGRILSESGQPLIPATLQPQNLTIPGEQFYNFSSQLGKTLKGNNGSANSVMGDLQSATQDALQRQLGGSDAALLAQGRHDYFNAFQVGNATRATPGVLSPTQLLSSVNSAQRNARFGAGNDLAQLAQWAKMNIGDTIPNSGTAQREFIQKLLTNPLATVGGVGAGLYGLNEASKESGLSPWDAAAAIPLMYAASRGMAGAPASDFTRALLQRSGQTLGALASSYQQGNR